MSHSTGKFNKVAEIPTAKSILKLAKIDKKRALKAVKIKLPLYQIRVSVQLKNSLPIPNHRQVHAITTACCMCQCMLGMHMHIHIQHAVVVDCNMQHAHAKCGFTCMLY